MKRFVLCMMVAGLCSVVMAQQEGRNGRNGIGERPQRPSMEQMKEQMEKAQKELLAVYDKNQDGKLDAEELQEAEKDLNPEELQKKMRMARVLKLYKKLDTNGDGVLSDEEMEAASKKMKQGGPDKGRGGDKKGQGRKGTQKKHDKPNHDDEE